MSELTEFLLARIAEDEAAAREYHDMLAAREREMAVTGAAPGIALFAFSAPGGPGDPARVLAECERNRRIMELHASDDHHCPGEWLAWIGVRNDDYVGEQYEVRLCPTVRAMASVYADHPDYRDEWRP